jgi:EmrB/QacA subfamily drug resistance transporter
MTHAATLTPAGYAPRWALAGLSLSMLMSSLDTSIANVALPALAHGFGASFAGVQWIVLAYLLAITTLIVSAGRLGDVFGRRRMLLAGVGLFTAASVLCGLAPSLPLLILARALQGLGAAMMMALAVAMVGEAVPDSRRGAAMGLLATTSAIGSTLGPALGGLLIGWLGWRSIFLVNAPLGLLNLALVLWTLPADSVAARPDVRRFDLTGTALLVATLAAYALAMTQPGAGAAARLLLVAGAALGTMLFVRSQARAAFPLLPLTMFKLPVLSRGLAAGVLVSAVMMSTLVIGPFYLSGALGLQPAQVGMVMSAGPLVAALSGAPAGRLVDRFGSRLATTAGLAGMAAGVIALALAPGWFGVGGYVCAIALVTSCYALFQAANNTALIAVAGSGQRGVVSGLIGLSRNHGLISGASVMGALFAYASGGGDMGAAAPQALATGMRTSFIAAAGMMLLALVIGFYRRRAH